ncbi:Uncharacterized protein DAT39_015407 [Clarias magur]|uniref:Uncharacterized protein n=1 Tax=Clarias magur TaxID=1594786 RepID=A0A8J4XCD8_CLAMG|nr:Uncharacterized protein DAT39_015407 [Clarias magur]
MSRSGVRTSARPPELIRKRQNLINTLNNSEVLVTGATPTGTPLSAPHHQHCPRTGASQRCVRLRGVHQQEQENTHSTGRHKHTRHDSAVSNEQAGTGHTHCSLMFEELRSVALVLVPQTA